MSAAVMYVPPRLVEEEPCEQGRPVCGATLRAEGLPEMRCTRERHGVTDHVAHIRLPCQIIAAAARWDDPS